MEPPGMRCVIPTLHCSADSAACFEERMMFGWAIAFLIIALIAAVLGFGGIAGTAMAAAKIVFVVALVAFAISGVLGLTRRTY